jgi:hypothetical protein
MYKEMIEKECEQALKEYLEAESRFAEVASQFVSISKSGEGISMPPLWKYPT